ncbi:MAG: DUF4388 domain-containing protein [Acidobacteriota bacterium]
MSEENVTSREGSLETTQFAELLATIARMQESAVLVIQRRQLMKQVVFHEGVPVDCQSNLAHETLGRFMASKGRLQVNEANQYLAEAMTREMDLGALLVEKGVCKEEELPKIHQQCLAKKLLDGFSWRDGQYLVANEVPDVEAPRSMNVAQLIFMGVMRFAGQSQVDASMAALVGRPLKLNPDPFFSVDDIRFQPAQRQLLDQLVREQPRMDQLAMSSGLAPEELTRFLHSLRVLGLLDGLELTTELAPPPTGREELERLLLRDPQHPSDLLGLPAGSDADVLAGAYLRVAKLCAPWEADEDLAERAQEMFLRAARAYVELGEPAVSGFGVVDEAPKAKPKSDQALPPPTAPVTPAAPIAPMPSDPALGTGMLRPMIPAASANAFKIETNLLDPAVQHAKGKKLMEQKSYGQAITQLEFAFDLDPQNSEYRADLAYCRYLREPAISGSESLAELKEALRIDPDCGLAWYYSGEIHSRAGRWDQAEQMLRKAIKPMSPDRRPIEALHAMKKRSKGKK